MGLLDSIILAGGNITLEFEPWNDPFFFLGFTILFAMTESKLTFEFVVFENRK